MQKPVYSSNQSLLFEYKVNNYLKDLRQIDHEFKERLSSERLSNKASKAPALRIVSIHEALAMTEQLEENY
jgi:hypothetical protein